MTKPLDEAAKQSRLEGLRALRDLLTTAIANCESARDLASLSQRLMDALADIEAAEKAAPPKEGTALDELEQRRAAAGKHPAGAPGAGQRRQRR